MSVYYSDEENKSAEEKKFIYYIFHEDGSRVVFHYKLSDVPEDVKMQFPMMFEGYLEKRIAEEKGN